MRHIILHIGYPKTGSSALQTTFLASREALRAEGFFFPDCPGGLCNVFTAKFHPAPHTLFPYSASASSPDMLAEELQQDFERLTGDVERSPCDTGIISSESLIAVDTHDAVGRVRDWLAARAERVTIVCYVRDPQSFAASLIQERVKWGGQIPDEDQPVPTSRFSITLPLWEDIFGRDAMIVRSAARQDLLDGDVVADFSALIGYAGMLDRSSVYGNEGLSHDAVLLLNALNGLDPRLGATAEFRRLWDLPGAKFRLDQSMAERLAVRAKPETDYLLANWGISWPDPGHDAVPTPGIGEPAARFLSKWIKQLHDRA